MRDRSRYAKLHGTYWRHPRVLPLSLEAIGLHALAMSYAADNKTDGYVPALALRSICGKKIPKRILFELVSQGFFIENKDGFFLKNWSKHNITNAEWEDRKKQIRERVQSHREQRQPEEPPPDNADVTRYKGVTKRVTSDHDSGLMTHDTGQLTTSPRSPHDRRETDVPPVEVGRDGAGKSFSIVVRGYQARYEREAKDSWMAIDANRRELEQIAAYIAAQSDPQKAANEMLDGFFRDDWARTARWPLKRLAKDPAKYRAPPAPTVADTTNIEIELKRLEGERRDAWKRFDNDTAAKLNDRIEELIARLPTRGRAAGASA